MDLNEQKKRINALENIEETKSRANILDLVTKGKEINPGPFKTTYTGTIYQTNTIVWPFVLTAVG